MSCKEISRLYKDRSHCLHLMDVGNGVLLCGVHVIKDVAEHKSKGLEGLSFDFIDDLINFLEARNAQN